MLLFKCDWCARTIDDSQEMGIYTTQMKNLGLPSKSLEVLMQSKHICKKCMEKAGILMLAAQPSEAARHQIVHQVAGESADKPESDIMTEQAAAAKEPETTVPAEPVPIEPVSQPEQNPASQTSESGKKEGKVVDVDKVLSLKKAGWRVKDIADDMNLEPARVSNILSYTKSHHPEKWKAFGLPM